MIAHRVLALRHPGAAGIGQFLRFAAVGAIGFCIDAAVLVIAVQAAGLNPISGRFVSFAVAVVATYALNRAWAFSDDVGFLRGLRLYIGVQSVGFLCNLAVYSVLYAELPKPWNLPIACLAVASALALIINFAGAKLIVFHRQTPNKTE